MKASDRSYWEEHVKSLAASGLNRAEYCRRHGLKYKQLYAWQERLAQASSPNRKAFVKAKALTEPKAKPRAEPLAQGVRLVTASGAALQFAPSSDPRWIARVLVALGGVQ